eukprot:TRINITY_DN8291_c0_g1_i1.p3 TRINITY_DN8291_c0_g1~~TRINITY_DN8291_c0_g1_i1.p3  ORF type:complete len:119 (-),score=35.15 TRINITY_DN8291_c0_g1_i1:1225-1581(-)
MMGLCIQPALVGIPIAVASAFLVAWVAIVIAIWRGSSGEAQYVIPRFVQATSCAVLAIAGFLIAFTALTYAGGIAVICVAVGIALALMLGGELWSRQCCKGKVQLREENNNLLDPASS